LGPDKEKEITMMLAQYLRGKMSPGWTKKGRSSFTHNGRASTGVDEYRSGDAGEIIFFYLDYRDATDHIKGTILD